MSIEAFKESIVNPLKKSIEQQKSATLAQFPSRIDLNRQWDVAVGMELALTHIESTYAAKYAQAPQGSPDVELPPQN